ncbi:IS5/IS1182 family transposase, partial [Mesorhizobium sp. M0587]
MGRQDRNQLDASAMPYKHNADRRHHVGKMKFRVTNWRDY